VRRFLLRRLLWFALTLFAVVTLAFALMRGVRGGPFDGERPLPAAIERNLRAAYHLDWPLWKQYLEYVGPLNLDEHGAELLGGDGTRVLGGVLTGDFGPSFRYRDFTVNDILAQSLPISLTLGTLALLFALSVGIPAGLASALLRGRALDVALRLATSLGIALPSFVLASGLLFLFAIVWPLFPVAGYGSWRHLVLPSLALGAPFAAYAARLVRTGALEVLAQDYVRTARAKGLGEWRVLAVHALRNAAIPIVTLLGLQFAQLLGGAVVTETIFAWPGVGRLVVEAIFNRDFPVVQGVVLVVSLIFVAVSVLIDVAYALLDPRIRTELA